MTESEIETFRCEFGVDPPKCFIVLNTEVGPMYCCGGLREDQQHLHEPGCPICVSYGLSNDRVETAEAMQVVDFGEGELWLEDVHTKP